MPPLILIDDDELLDYPVGDPPMQGEDDRTVFCYRRLLPSERQPLAALFLERGKLDQRGHDNATIAICLHGWTRLMGRNGAIAWPMPEQAEAQRRQVLAIVEHLPDLIVAALVERMHDPSPEALLKNWREQSTGNDSLPAPPGNAIPASTVDVSVPSPANPSPVISGE